MIIIMIISFQNSPGVQPVVNQLPPVAIVNQLPPQVPIYGYNQERPGTQMTDPHQQQQQQQNVYFEQQQQQQHPMMQQQQQQQQQKQQANMPPAHPQPGTSTPTDIMKHLHDMVQQSKIAATQEHQPYQTGGAYSTPERPDAGFSTPTKDNRRPSPMSESPISSRTIAPLPQNWKTATDPEGKIYYYHVVTRYCMFVYI